MRALEGRRSVSAKIRQHADLFGKELAGSGVYFEQRAGREHLMRLELRIQSGERVSSLLQVLSPPGPDGQYLWIHRRLPNGEKLSRIDVARATRALDKAQKTPGRATGRLLPGLGGLTRLLRGLHAAFDFTDAKPGQFDRVPVWRLRGQWKPERLAKILPDQKAAIEAGEPADLSRLPEHLPDHVVLILGQEDLFPYRIEYRRGMAAEAGQSEGGRALVTMELFDVKFDVPIEQRQFIYSPGSVEFADETAAFLKSLGPTK